MFEPTSEYASDLEWMIQSGQVSRDILLEALVQEFYPRVYRLLVALLDDQPAARKATQETFARAIAELHRFRAEDGVEIWLFRIALSACQGALQRVQIRRSILSIFPFRNKLEHLGDSVPDSSLDAELWLAIDGLDAQTRQVISLHYLLGWPIEQIASLFSSLQTEVLAAIETARSCANQVLLLGQEGMASPLLPEKPSLDEFVGKSLQARWHSQPLTNDDLEPLTSNIHRRSGWISLQQRRIFFLIEVLFLLMIILVAFGSTWWVNLMGAGEATPTFTPPVVTVVVTKIVYKIVTPAPNQTENLATPNAPLSLPANLYTHTRSGETLEQIAVRLGTSVSALQKLNRLPEGITFQSGQRLLNPIGWPQLSLIETSPVPTLKPSPPIQDYFSSEIILHLLNRQPPAYANVWLDASLIDYGPPSYIGPPRVVRYQTWIEAGKSLTLIGYPDQVPEEIILQKGEQTYIALPNQDALWFSEWRRQRPGSTVTPEILKHIGISPLDTRDLKQSSTYRLGPHEMLVNRPVIVIDLLDQDGLLSSRAWIDEQTGLLLRRILYLEGDQEKPSAEFKVQAISYNENFPQALFNPELPWRGSFARDALGEPVELDYARFDKPAGRPRLYAPPPPADLDLAASRLIFQFPESFQTTEPTSQIQLIADQYAAGRVIFGNPWATICARSPNGQWIAFVSQPVHARNPNSLLNWFDLSDPMGQFFTQYDQMGVTEFAFSPDSRRLAYFHNRNSLGFGYLSVVDLSSQLSRFLMKVGDLKSLVWSPDGRDLAMIVRFDPASYMEDVIVVDAGTGQITYSAPIDYQSNAVKDWPMEEWGVEFPVEMGDLQSCSSPPGQVGSD